MLRDMHIVRYIKHSHSWYLHDIVPLYTEKTCYRKGDIIENKHHLYIVIGDHPYLRVERYNHKVIRRKPLNLLFPEK
ncbi:hypothetical protein NIE88_00260 [Sporolactobacillus shoreicorticis]|uniref:Uncharacterized protein n=1 Tax=Sporolactobacillus shoreicorticis TaxID=1923877 RepID=A0ABW5S3K4_9BACL|nr:hypothetical protein [Sporolactobacillus shoreicorticis]MCO7124223.1 hypothetical protein [Sporolactobacillus shoreicorticis]